MYSTILVPIDISHTEGAGKMLDVAKTLASPSATFVLFYAQPDVPSLVKAQLPAGAVEQASEGARATLTEIAQKFAPSAAVEIDVRQGTPHHAILDAAKERKADLIIMASHKPELSDYLLGSVAAQVVRHARCAIHVIR